MEIARFELAPWSRRIRKIYAAVLGLVLYPIALFFPMALVGILRQEGVSSAISLSALALIPVALWLSRKASVWKSRGRLVVADDLVLCGEGATRKVFACEDVDMITVPTRGEDGFWVKVRGQGATAKVFLPDEMVDECAKVLRERCRNALFVDYEGVEHLPVESRRPLRNLVILEGRHRTLGLACAALALWPAIMLLATTAAMRDPATDGVSPVVRYGAYLKIPVIAVFLGFLLWEVWRRFQLAKKARQERIRLFESGVSDQDNSVADPYRRVDPWAGA